MKYKTLFCLCGAVAVLWSPQYPVSTVSATPLVGNAITVSDSLTEDDLTLDIDVPSKTQGLSLDVSSGSSGEVIGKMFQFKNNSPLAAKILLTGYHVNDFNSSNRHSGIELADSYFDPSAMEEDQKEKRVFLFLNTGTYVSGDFKSADSYTWQEDAKAGQEVIFSELSDVKYNPDSDSEVGVTFFYEPVNMGVILPGISDTTRQPLKVADFPEAAKVPATKAAGATAQSTNYLSLRFDGTVNKNADWTGTETLNATPVFDISPIYGSNYPERKK